MAFRQPTYHAPQRAYPTHDPEQQELQAPQHSQPLEESQEWILFSPVAASITDVTNTTSTSRTQTAGRSRISDFGSLDTAARSHDYDESHHTEAAVDDEEDGELDSLDSHLHEFRAEPSVYRESSRNVIESSGPVLPTHDGLGSFRIDRTAMGEDIQEHLYAFERYNPRRIKRRRESLEMGQLELESERLAELDRTRRIESWRMEQSRLLVDEIRRETRRRKQSMTSERISMLEDREQEDRATMSIVESTFGQAIDDRERSEEENEGFWSRITRRVIRDLMGIDDYLLSIIFGESLPEDDDLSPTPTAPQHFDAAHGAVTTSCQFDESSWEYRLLERIARELGILVNQLADHPGAFSTYLHTQQTTLPYAGLPVIPEAARDPIPDLHASTLTSVGPQFQPTLPATTQPLSIMHISQTHRDHHSPEDIESIPKSAFRVSPSSQPISREEWERDLDIKMVFRYLRSRFTSRPVSPQVPFTHETSHLATASTSETAARAARVRQHHPLVTRHRPPHERRTFKATVPSSGSGVGVGVGMGVRRGSSSCASERTRISANRNSIGSSSRHYWDIGGSIGSGSLIASTGFMGSWGEV